MITGGDGDRTGDFGRIDPPEISGIAELAGLAIGAGRRRAALVAPCQASVDAVAVRLVGDDENAVLGMGGEGARDEKAGGDEGAELHGMAGPGEDSRSIDDKPGVLKMINQGEIVTAGDAPAKSKDGVAFRPRWPGGGGIWRGFRSLSPLTAPARLPHGAKHERPYPHFRHLPRDYELAIRWLRPSFLLIEIDRRPARGVDCGCFAAGGNR